MAYAFYDQTIGAVSPTDIDNAGPGPGPNAAGTTFGRMNFYLEEMKAYDPALGGATLKYLRYSGTIAAGTICEITATLTGNVLTQAATPWAGVANSGRTLVVALNPGTVGQYSWFVVQGVAIVTCQGAPVAGNPVYWQAAGVVSPTAVAGKQVLSAAFSTAPAVTVGTTVLTATQAVVNLNRSIAQGQIT